ncbi:MULTISPECIES: DMT family transporter [Micrococcaceae]|uniref:DMT family transporter n=1 Tax=unclassified Kocuria TaxID=2649579 RepID=UPI001010F83F|nr:MULTISPECIES: DMT family transporter [unclassified Kocuria]
MTSSALAMVLVAAVLHAAWNLAAKAKRGDAYTFVWWYAVATAAVTAPIGIGQIIQSGGWNMVGPALVWAPALSAAIHIGYNLALQTGYDRAPLGVVYPAARGTGPILTMIVAVAFLSERPGWWALAGALVIVGGIVVTAVPGRNPDPSRSLLENSVAATDGPSDSSGSRILAGLRWGVLTGTFIAGYTLWDDHSVTALNQSPIPYFALSSVYQAVFMTVGLGRRRRSALSGSLKSNWRIIATIGVLSPAAYILVLTVMQTQPVSLVAPLRETSIVVGSLLAWLIFREPRPGRRLVGALLVVGGVALISL